ncbi:MAG: hypothetical protein LQ338_008348, partial [Usnochroma carphineum]
MRAGDWSLGQGYKETTSKKKRSGTNLGDERLRCDNAEPRANSSAPAWNGSISDIEALEKPKHQEHVSRHSRSKRGRNYTGTLDDSGEDGMNKSTPVSRNNSNTDAGVRENRSKEEHRSRKNSMDNLALPSPRIQDATPRANSESIPQTSMVDTDGLVGGLVAQSMLGTSNGAHFEDRSHEDPKQRRKPTNSPMLQKAINSHAVLCDTRGCTGYLYSSEATAADKWFEMLNSITQELLNKHRKENTKGRVKIAILDTGIDRNHPDYRRRWKGRIRNTRSWIGDSAYEDSCGHGTHSAGLLMSIAPEARLYIARVAKDFRGADADSVAQAIDHAVDEWNVDIISISFGFKRWHDNIEEAINKALRNNMLIFAAASNDGARQGIAFPASATLKVIGVNSADGNGAASKYNPPPLQHGHNFSALGED